MSSLRIRSRKDGSQYVSVLFRENGKQSSVSFNDISVAKRFRSLVDKIGSVKANEVLLVTGDHHEPRLSELVERYIDNLTGVQKGTIDQYRGYLTRDIAPV